MVVGFDETVRHELLETPKKVDPNNHQRLVDPLDRQAPQLQPRCNPITPTTRT